MNEREIRMLANVKIKIEMENSTKRRRMVEKKQTVIIGPRGMSKTDQADYFFEIGARSTCERMT